MFPVPREKGERRKKKGGCSGKKWERFFHGTLFQVLAVSRLPGSKRQNREGGVGVCQQQRRYLGWLHGPWTNLRTQKYENTQA